MKYLYLLLVVLFIVQWSLTPKPLSESDFGKPIVVVGEVLGIPKHNKLGLRFVVKIKKINGKMHRGKLELSWHQYHRIIHSGELWRWTVKLKPIHGMHNPGGFNLERWARMRGIIGSGYVVQKTEASCLAHASRVRHLRSDIEAFIREKLVDSRLRGNDGRVRGNESEVRGKDEKSSAAVINALTVGSKQLLFPESWLVFQRTGTSHLIAISGLHVGLVVAISYFLFNGFLRCFPWVLLRCPAQRMASIFSVIVAWLYGFLVGFSLPTQRAVIMVTALMLSSLISQPISLWKRLLIAFFIVIAWQPLSVFSPSFWLSFIAVFWLAYAFIGKWRAYLLLNLGLLPITLFCFHQFSLVSLLANAVAIPWVTLLIVPLCLLASIIFLFSKLWAGIIWWFAAKCFLPLWLILQWLAHYSLSVWLHPINDFFILLSTLLGILCCAAPRGLPLQPLGVALLIPLFFYFPARPKPNTVWLTVLDVGQGLSAVIQTAHHVLIYDTGPRYVTGFDAGRSVLMPFLQTEGIRKINILMVSHGDNDHIGGSFWLVQHYPVEKMLSSVPQSRWHRAFHHCFAGQKWRWDGVNFRVLWPLKGAVYEDNNSSCVLRVSVAGKSILLTGDIEKSAEHALLLQRALLSSSVLIAAHHGSRSSSSMAFVQAVHPAQVIIPVGYRNRYHFPAKSVLQRYQAIGAQIFSTSQQGAVRIALGIAGRIMDNGRLD